jgi:hypothetical protein
MCFRVPKHQISNYAFVGVLEEFDFVLKASFFCCWWLWHHSDHLQALSSNFFFKPTFCKGSCIGSWWCFFQHYFKRCHIAFTTSFIHQPWFISGPSSIYRWNNTPSYLVVGDLIKRNEPKKKKPIKVDWEINQIY